ncbi:MAG: four helix bundle protein [Candidatus Binatia bacterium]
MDERAFKQRTQRLALQVIELVEALPRSRTADVIGRQLLRSATSVGANYRSACRGKSTADVLAKLAIVEEEADETIYWLELLVQAQIACVDKVQCLIKESDEIVAMRWRRSKLCEFENSAHEYGDPGHNDRQSKIQNRKSKMTGGVNAYGQKNHSHRRRHRLEPRPARAVA